MQESLVDAEKMHLQCISLVCIVTNTPRVLSKHSSPGKYLLGTLRMVRTVQKHRVKGKAPDWT